MKGYVVGESVGWDYRARSAHYFSVDGDGDYSEWWDSYSNSAWGGGGLQIPLLSEIGTLLTDLKGELVHGDIIDFGNYRGCGCFVVEPVDNVGSDFYLYKTLEEMGYGVPPYFTDAPDGYYQNSELYYVWKHVDFAPQDHPLFDEVAARLDCPTYDHNNDWAEDIVLSKFPDEYMFFQDFLNGSGKGSWVARDTFSGLDYYDAKHWKHWRERIAYRASRSRAVAQAVCDVIFHQRLGLPAGIAAMIGEYAASKGGGFVDDRSSTLKPKAKRRKTRKKKKVDSDDEDWVP